MNTACPNYNNISRQTTTRDVLHYYTKERKHAKERLAKAPSRIYLTSNIWKYEHSADEYVRFTTQWIDSDWKSQQK